MENKLTHLQMVQANIARMAGNSFLLKGWSVTLVSALFALAADKTNILFLYLTYFPVVMFWALDGYFLRQERLFRALYNHVRVQAESAIDFSMDTARFASSVSDWPGTVLSRTLLLFHGTILGTVLIIMCILIAAH